MRKVIRRWTPSKADIAAMKEPRAAPYVPALVPAGTREATFTGPVSGTPACFIGKGMIAVVEITKEATVIIEGRPHPTLTWIEAARFTASEARVIPSLTELRATVIDNTGDVAVTLRTP